MFTLSASITERLIGLIFDFITRGGENLGKDVVTKKEIKVAIESAAGRFANEYEDKELARVLTANTKFYDLESVRNAINEILKHPGDPAPQVKIEKEFAMVLPESQRGLAGKATQAYLELLRQQLIGVEKLNEKLNQILLNRLLLASERTAEASEQSVDLQKTIAEGIKELVGSKEKRPDLNLARENYLHKFIEKYSGTGIWELGTYVNLPVDASDSSGKQEKIEGFDSIFAISYLPQKWVLLGDAGSGKTATLRKLACFQAEQCLNNPIYPIPVVIDLWTWRGEASTFTTFFEEYINDSSNLNSYGLLRSLHDYPIRLLQENQLSLYLDGLDELPDLKVRLLKEWLSKTDISVRITCRESDFIGIRKLELPLISLKPLGWDQISIFAERFLGSTEGPEFISNVVDVKAGEKTFEEYHILRFVRSPFFLLLVLDYYKESRKVEFSRWSLFNYIVKRLWKTDRIQELLTAHKLARNYSEASQITTFLADWGMEYLRSHQIDRGQFENQIASSLEDALIESGLLQYNADQFRFRHPLFAEYFAANKILEQDDYAQYAKDGSNFAGMLVVLASSSEKKRRQIQESLLRVVSDPRNTFEPIEENRGLLWALGEIGDRDAIPPLIDLHRNSSLEAKDAMLWFMTSSINMRFAGTSFLIAASRISSRLIENDVYKKIVIQVIEEDLFSKPRSIEKENSKSYDLLTDFDSNDAPFMIHEANLLKVWNAVLSIGEVGGQQAAEILYKGLLNFAQEYPPGAVFAGNVRRYGFAASIARLGKSGIPILLTGLSSDDTLISHPAADALGLFNFPLPLAPLFNLLALNPDSVIRAGVARKLGHMRLTVSIPHLAAALNDTGVITFRHELMRWDAQYNYVADSAALALAAIGTEECISIITERLYNSDGSPSINLSLERINHQDGLELKVYEARQALRQYGLIRLLPLMGHINVGQQIIDPIAQAIIRGYENEGDAIIQQLINYLIETDDNPSRMWTLLVLGTIGNSQVAETLNRCLSDKFPVPIRDAAARGLGILVSRNLNIYNSRDILDRLVANLTGNPSDNYSWTGLGIAEILKACVGEEPAVVSDVIRILLAVIIQNDPSKSRAMLDALESVYTILSPLDIKDQKINSLLEKEVKPVLIESPSYLMKMANRQFAQGLEEDNPDQFKEALDYYLNVELYKGEKLPRWSSLYTEHDWIQLECGDIEIQFKLGEVFSKLNRDQDALLRYEQATANFNHEDQETDDRLLFAKSLYKAGLIRFRFEEFDQAIQLFKQVVKLQDKFSDDKLLLSAWLGLQRSYIELGKWREVCETEENCIQLADATKGQYLDRCLARFNIGLACAKLGLVDKSMRYYREAEVSAKRYGLREILAQTLVYRASLEISSGNENLANRDIEGAEDIYKEIDSWSDAVDVLEQAAETVFESDPARRLPLYKKALNYLEKKQDPQKLAFAWRAMALAHQDLDEPSEADSCFHRALEGIANEKASGLEAIIRLDYGRFLYRNGRAEDGTSMALHGLGILAELGLNEDYAETVLAEMSTNPEWKLPSAIVSVILGAIFDAITKDPDLKDGVLERLDNTLRRARIKNWKPEEEFLNSLHALLVGQKDSLSLNNPYIEPYEKLKEALDNFFVFRETADNKTTEQRKITNQEEQEDLLHLLEQVESAANGNKELGAKLFPRLQELAVDSNIAPELQVLARVLVHILAGSRHPNLDELPNELVLPVSELLERLMNRGSES